MTMPDPRQPAADEMPRPLQDVARFRADDADELVAASFACPLCLHVDVALDIASQTSLGPLADCRCRRCASDWFVLVEEDQLVRLTRMAGTRVSTYWCLDLHFGWEWL